MEPSRHRDGRLVESLATAARNLINSGNLVDLEHALVQVVRSAVETVPGADAGGITLASPAGPAVSGRAQVESRAPSNEAVLRLDELQAELRQGPCLTALGDPPLGAVVVAEDLHGADADRWPRFAAGAERYGYRSMCSTQLSADGGVHAALNLYGREPAAFDANAETLAGLFGVQAALLLYGAERAGQLRVALESRDLIGQAKGILMERFAVDADHAFQMLVRSSQDTNIKLVDVARWLVDQPRQARPPELGSEPGSDPAG